MPSRIDMAGHTKAFDYPVMGHSLKAEIFSSASGTRTNNASVQAQRTTHWASPAPLTRMLEYCTILCYNIFMEEYTDETRGTLAYLSGW